MKWKRKGKIQKRKSPNTKFISFVPGAQLFLNSSLINIHDHGIPVTEKPVNREFLFIKYLLIETVY